MYYLVPRATGLDVQKSMKLLLVALLAVCCTIHLVEVRPSSEVSFRAPSNDLWAFFEYDLGTQHTSSSID